MKKKFKILGLTLSACMAFGLAALASGCSAKDKTDKWFEQLFCEHKYDEGVETQAPTCTEEGLLTYTCTECGKTKKKDIAMIEHTEVEIPSVSPTCTEVGYTDGVKCAVCEEVLQQPKVVAKIPHFEVQNSEAVAATCTTAGLKPGTHCARCDEVITEETVIPALGHLEVPDTAVEATCTTSGLTEGKHCKRCNEVLVAQETIAAMGHSDNDSNDICDICSAAKNIIEDMPEVDEFVVGKTYRIYYMEGYKPTGGYGYQPYFYIDVTTSDGDTVALAVTPGGESFASTSGTRFVFEDSFGDNYRDVTIKAGTYTAPDASGNQVSFTIDENTVISNVSLSPTEYQGYVRRIEKSW